MGIRIGIDLGGTKIEGIALNGSVELARLRANTPRGDYAATLDAILGMVKRLEATAGSASVHPRTAAPSHRYCRLYRAWQLSHVSLISPPALKIPSTL